MSISDAGYAEHREIIKRFKQGASVEVKRGKHWVDCERPSFLPNQSYRVRGENNTSFVILDTGNNVSHICRTELSAVKMVCEGKVLQRYTRV